MKRKKIALLLSITMAVATLMSGCGNQQSAGDKPTDGQTQQDESAQSGQTQDGADAGQSGSQQADAGQSGEMTTFTFAKVAYPSVTLPDGQTSEDNVVIDYIRDKYNVDLVLDWQAEASEYNNKLSMNIASGSLPDIFFCDNYRTFLQLAQNGLLADLTDIYDDNISDTIKAIDASFNGRHMGPVTVDGRLMAIPGGNLDGSQSVLWLRKDWLDNLGLEVPETLEDLEKVLSAFVNDDPDGNGVDDTVGLVIEATEPVKEYSHTFGLEPVFYALGAYPNYWMEDENGEVYYGSTGSNMKDALTLIHDWYEKGLIDRQFATRIGSGETEAVFTSGQAGAFFGPIHVTAITEAFTNNPDIELVPANAPLTADGKFNYVLPSPMSSMLCISSKCSDPALAVKIIGIGNDLYRGFDEEANEIFNAANIAASSSGRRAVFPQGAVTYDYFNIIETLGKAVKENIETGTYTPYEGMTQYDKDQVVLASSYADGTDQSEISFKAYYYRYIGSELLTDSRIEPVDAAYYYTTESSPALQTELDTLEQEMYLSIIIGDRSVDYFDEFVEQWNSIGGETLLKEVNEILGK